MGDLPPIGQTPVPPLPSQPNPYIPLDPPATEAEKSKKMLAGLLGIFLGGLGVHKFILGYNSEGFIHLGGWFVGTVLTVITCGLAVPLAMIPGVIGLIEGIIYLTKSDDDFVRIYVRGRKPWF